MVYLSKVRVFLLWFLSIAVAFVSWRFMVVGVEQSMEFVVYHAIERKWAFYTHITLAPVALALMPLQFWQGLRARRPNVHRWIGRTYGVSVLLAGIGSIFMALGTQAGPVAAFGFGFLGVFWLGTTAYGIWLILQKRIAEHRRWMMRSAALTFAAVTLRLYMPILMTVFGEQTGYTLVAWLCWVPNLILVELYLRRPLGKATALAT